MNLRYTDKYPSMLIWTAFVLSCCHVSVPAFAEEISIPGTSVSLDAPDGFTVASSFSGLENLEDGSSITISELPAEAYDELIQVFSDLDAATAGFAQQGISIERTDTYSVGGQRIPVLIGSQPIPGGEVRKYLALFRGDVTMLMTFNVFDPRILTPSSVESAITSVRLSPAATLDQKVDQLRFSFETAAPFRIGDVLGGSTVLLPTFEGADPTGLMPVVIIARSVAVIPASSDAELAAQQLLSETQGFEGAEITTTEEAVFAGGPANYLEAATEDRKIVQYLRIGLDPFQWTLDPLGRRYS